jgi:hypothetical protein
MTEGQYQSWVWHRSCLVVIPLWPNNAREFLYGSFKRLIAKRRELSVNHFPKVPISLRVLYHLVRYLLGLWRQALFQIREPVTIGAVLDEQFF